MIADEHAHVGSRPLCTLKQVITSSNGLVKKINVGNADEPLTRNLHCPRLSKAEERGDGRTVS